MTKPNKTEVQELNKVRMDKLDRILKTQSYNDYVDSIEKQDKLNTLIRDKEYDFSNNESERLTKFEKLQEELGFIVFTEDQHKSNFLGKEVIIGITQGDMLNPGDNYGIQLGINYPLRFDGGFEFFPGIRSFDFKSDDRWLFGNETIRVCDSMVRAFYTDSYGFARFPRSINRSIDSLEKVVDSHSIHIAIVRATGIKFLHNDIIPELNLYCTLDDALEAIINYKDQHKEDMFLDGLSSDEYNHAVERIMNVFKRAVFTAGIDIKDTTDQMPFNRIYHIELEEDLKRITKSLDNFNSKGGMFYINLLYVARGIQEFDSIPKVIREKYRIITDKFLKTVGESAMYLGLEMYLKYNKRSKK